MVLVAGADGRPLARGFWDATSPIAVRILGADGELDVGAEIDRRLAEALGAAAAGDRSARTDAFRWVHGEADALPGVHVDVYGAALSLRFDGGGARAFYRELPARLREAARGPGFRSRPSSSAGHAAAAASDGERTLPLYGSAPTARSRSGKTACCSAPTCAAARRGACFSINGRTARWSVRWRAIAGC